MRQPQHDSQDVIQALEDLVGENYRDITFYPFEGEEIYAPYETATIFVNEIIANAEPNFVAKNFTAVKAAMIEAGLWMHIITTLHLHADMVVDETRPEVQTLNEAERRMSEAGERYQEAISTPTRPEDENLLYLWQTVSATPAYAAILSKHLEEMRQAGDNHERAGAHNRAARNAFMKMGVIVVKLTNAAKTKTNGPRPSRRQAQRCLYGARQAMLEYNEAQELIHASKPVRKHPSIANDDETDREVREMVDTMKLEGVDFMLSVNPQHPDRSMVAYVDDDVYRVKHAADEYPDSVDSAIAEHHAARLMESTKHAAEHHPESEHLVNDWAHNMLNNAIAELHRVERTGFAEMIQLLRAADPNPLTVREAAKEAVIHGNSGADLLMQLSPEQDGQTSDHQAIRVISAAHDAGLQKGQLHAICAIMGKTPQQMGISPRTVSVEQMLEILEACPVEMHSHQVMTIAKILGVDREDYRLIQWIEEYCDGEDDEDDEEYEDDDEYEDEYEDDAENRELDPRSIH